MKALSSLLILSMTIASQMASAQGASAPFTGPKKTICTATINSDDEKLVFQKYLHPDHFNFVELVKNKSDVGFLNRACRNEKLKCDVTLISGHFGGGFTDNKEFFLPLEDIEKVSCGSCPNVLGGADVVYLFGCNTLAGKTQDGRTPQEYYDVLISEVGMEPAEARATVAVRYSAIGDSFYDRLRRVLKGSAVIGGFTSKAPLGEQIRPALAGYFGTSVSGLKMDGVLEDWERREISLAYYNELNRLRANTLNGKNQQLMAARKRLQPNFGAIIDNGYIDVPGIQSGTTEDFVATRMCSINKSKDKLKVIEDIVNTNERTSVIQMLPFLMDISKKGDNKNKEQLALFANLSRNSVLRDLIAGETGIINELKQAPQEQLDTVDLAADLGWVSPQEKAAFYQQAAVYVWNNPSGFYENKKFLKKIAAQMQAVQLNQMSPSAMKGKAIFTMLSSLRENDVQWWNWAGLNIATSMNYYYNSYVANEKALSKPGLSEGLTKKYKTKNGEREKSR